MTPSDRLEARQNEQEGRPRDFWSIPPEEVNRMWREQEERVRRFLATRYGVDESATDHDAEPRGCV